MKKIFTLMLIAICAMTAKAQEPLYTINATVAADPEDTVSLSVSERGH